MKIGILVGGISSEKEVSIASGKSIEFACLALGHKVQMLDPKDDIENIKSSIMETDLVFNGLHGGDGENGKISKFLESLDVPFTGSDSVSSAICMNKSKTKEIVSKNSILTPDWLLVKHNDQLDSVGNLGFPLVVKPNDQGSTIGLSIVDSKSQLLGAYSLARNFADSIIFERYIKGRELTCSIIGDKAYPVLEIIPKKDIYDYECKYTKGMSEYICPADLSESISLSIQDISLKAHTALGCRHYSRVDFLLDENDNIWFLEINTLPGMTETSLLPKSLKSAGLSFNEVIELIINEACGVSK